MIHKCPQERRECKTVACAGRAARAEHLGANAKVCWPGPRAKAPVGAQSKQSASDTVSNGSCLEIAPNTIRIREADFCARLNFAAAVVRHRKAEKFLLSTPAEEKRTMPKIQEGHLRRGEPDLSWPGSRVNAHTSTK